MHWKKHNKTIFLWFITWGMLGMAEAKIIPLPRPCISGTMSVEQAIAQRRSIREYGNLPLRLEELSQLLWAVQGSVANGSWRTVPSAGATYPLEIYVTVKKVEGLTPGLYHYRVHTHDLELLRKENLAEALARACWNQYFIQEAAVVILFAVNYERTTSRYGKRGIQYVYMECGHAGQNLYLQAEALGLGTVAVGAFDDEKVQSLLGISEPVVYIFPVGRKKP